MTTDDAVSLDSLEELKVIEANEVKREKEIVRTIKAPRKPIPKIKVFLISLLVFAVLVPAVAFSFLAATKEEEPEPAEANDDPPINNKVDLGLLQADVQLMEDLTRLFPDSFDGVSFCDGSVLCNNFLENCRSTCQACRAEDCPRAVLFDNDDCSTLRCERENSILTFEDPEALEAMRLIQEFSNNCRDGNRDRLCVGDQGRLFCNNLGSSNGLIEYEFRIRDCDCEDGSQPNGKVCRE